MKTEELLVLSTGPATKHVLALVGEGTSLRQVILLFILEIIFTDFGTIMEPVNQVSGADWHSTQSGSSRRPHLCQSEQVMIPPVSV